MQFLRQKWGFYEIQRSPIIKKMEKIIRNPGLQHPAENVFWNLDVEDLKTCAQINQSFAKSILLFEKI